MTVIRGRLRGRVAALAAALVVAPGLAACGEDDEPTQTTAPAETGVEETATSTTEASSTGENGGKPESDEPSSDPIDNEAEIMKTLETVLEGSDPVTACNELVTERFLRRSYGDAAGCEAALKSAKPAQDAGVEDIVVHPDSVAQASARPKGGIYDGQKLRAELVLDDETWKLDSLRSNVPVGP
ncbi:MAG TPA: hypothetical protein VD766_09385 [Solirubrobacterales bacterium]|nr:hypothetical protein [Solirubrobacterales bacterium]